MKVKLICRSWDEKGGLQQQTFETDNLEALARELFKPEIRNNIHSLVLEKAAGSEVQTMTFENKGFITRSPK